MHYGLSSERVGDFKDEEADCLFLDGDHTYKGLKTDLHLYAPKVRPGGYIFFDDYSASFMVSMHIHIHMNIHMNIHTYIHMHVHT